MNLGPRVILLAPVGLPSDLFARKPAAAHLHRPRCSLFISAKPGFVRRSYGTARSSAANCTK